MFKLLILVTIYFLKPHEVKSVSFECNFGYIDLPDSTSTESYYYCETINAWDFDKSKVKVINGTHVKGRKNNDVRVMYIYGIEKLDSFPEKITNFFPNLIGLTFSFENSPETKIRAITSSDLKDYPDLLHFGLFDTPFTSLPADLFKHNRKLTSVIIKNLKNLHHIGANLLGNLSRLNLAVFEQNRCIDEIAEGLDEVQELNRRLHILCPSSITTTTQNPPVIDSCPSACSNEIQNLEGIVEAQGKLIIEQKQSFDDLKNLVKNNTERIMELEMRVRECSVRP
jgi:hypothetical protein